MKNSNDHNELIHLITQKLTGESSPEDLSRLDQLVGQSEENRLLYEQLSQAWEETEKASGITREDTESEWLRLQRAIRKESATNSSSFSFMKIAASIILLIAAGITFYVLDTDEQTKILAQSIQEELLVDGSNVTLNANSELSYSADYGESSREVTLAGEAFFDVERNPESPFVIHTNSMDVTVLGTSFTVRAIDTESTAEVVVTTGLVEVSYQGKAVQLEIGEKGILDRNSGQLFKTVNNDANFMSWKTKVFRFDDLPLEEVVTLLNNAYQSSIYINGNSIVQCPVTVTFENQSLASIIEVLKATLGLTVKTTSKGIELGGAGC